MNQHTPDEDNNSSRNYDPQHQNNQTSHSATPLEVKIKEASPRVTYILIGITLLVFLFQLASTNWFKEDLALLAGIKANQRIMNGEIWRLLSPALLHGSWMHLGFNMYALYIFGSGLERYYGYTRFLALYLLGAFAGNVFSFLFTPSPSLGSSTAVFGLLGAQAVFLYQNKRLFGSVARRALVNIIIIAGANLLIGLSPGIDNWGHVGGLIGGSLFAWFGGPLLKIEGVFPNIKVVDGRKPRETLRAGVDVAALFALLAGAAALIIRFWLG